MRKNVIREARLRLGWSQEKLAQQLHCDRSYISRLERGRFEPPLPLLRDVSRVLEIPMAEFDLVGQAPTNHLLMLTEVRTMIERGSRNVARSLLEAMWADFMSLGQYELAEQVFYTWLESVDGDTKADELWPPIMGFLLMKGGKQTWLEAFEHTFEIQKRLIVAGQYSLAVILAKSVLPLNPPRKVRFRLLVGTGTSLLRTNNPQGSHTLYCQAAELWKPEDGKTNLGRCYHGIGAAALFANNFQEGLKWTDDALSVYNHLHSDLYFSALQNKGVAMALMANRPVAERMFSQCETHWNRLGNHVALENLHSDLQRLGFIET